MFLIFPAIFMTLIFAVFMAASLRLQSRLAYLLAVFILAYANVVLSIEIASILQQITTVMVLLINLFLLVIAWQIWGKAGKPALIGPFRDRPLSWKEMPPFRRYPMMYMYVVLVGLAYLAGAVLILTTPQNNYDSMTYHLSRVGYWLQHKSFLPWVSPNLRQTTFPMNAEIGVLWTVLFWGTDQLSGFVQWIGAWIAAAAVYGLAALLGAQRWQGVMVALLFLTFPEIALQSITTMNDLIAAAFVSVGVYCLFLGWRSGQNKLLWLSALALALAAGTKSSLFFLIPGLFLAMVLLSVTSQQNLRSKLVNFIVAGILSFALVGVYGYIQTIVYYGNPSPLSQWHVNPRPGLRLLAENLSLYSVQAIDLTGVPPSVQPVLNELRILAFKPLKPHLSLSQDPEWVSGRDALMQILSMYPTVHEDVSWFGLLFPILFIPAAIGQFFAGLRKKDVLRIGLLILVFGFGITLSYTLRWDLFKGRLFTLILPLASALLYPWFSNTWYRAWIGWIIVLVSVYVLYQTFLYNRAKPLIGLDSIWGKDAVSIRMNTNQKFEPVMTAIDARVPEDSRLATRIGTDTWDYPLFGPHFQRTIVPLDPYAMEIDINRLREQGIDYVLVEGAFAYVPDDLELIWQYENWFLYEFVGSP